MSLVKLTKDCLKRKKWSVRVSIPANLRPKIFPRIGSYSEKPNYEDLTMKEKTVRCVTFLIYGYIV